MKTCHDCRWFVKASKHYECLLFYNPIESDKKIKDGLIGMCEHFEDYKQALAEHLKQERTK